MSMAANHPRWLLALVACVNLCGQMAAAEANVQGVSISDLMSLRDLAGLAVSPDGRRALVHVQQADLTLNRIQTEWTLLQLDGANQHRSLGSAGPALFPETRYGRPSGIRSTLPPAWSPDGHWVAYVRATDRSQEIWKTRPDGTGSTRVLTAFGEIQKFTWSADGEAVIYEVSSIDARWKSSVRARLPKDFFSTTDSTLGFHQYH